MDNNNDEFTDNVMHDHRIIFLINPMEDEMYVDYGKQVTDGELIEAASQAAMDALEHVSDGNKSQALETIISEIRAYGNVILKRS